MREFGGKGTVEASVREIARRLLVGQTPPPTELEPILSRVNIQAAYVDPDLDISGELRRTEDGLEIAYSNADSTVRRRFTIAHEIGHAVLELTGPRCPRKGRELETICDRIASELLLPHDLLHSELKEPLDLAEIQRIASRFEVSVTSVAVRLSRDFGLVACLAEDGEVNWVALPERARMRGLRGWVTKLVKPIEEPRGSKEVALNSDGRRVRLLMEWQPTGANRTLFVLSSTESAAERGAGRKPAPEEAAGDNQRTTRM